MLAMASGMAQSGSICRHEDVARSTHAHLRDIPCPEAPDERPRRKDRRDLPFIHFDPLLVSEWRPWKDRSAGDQARHPPTLHKTSIGKLADRRRKRSIPDKPFHVKDRIDLPDRRSYFESIRGISRQPGHLPPVEIHSSAFRAGAMSSRKRRSLIQEEQLGITIRLHDLPFPSLEFEQAGDPGFQAEWTNDLPAIVMQQSAISHPGASGAGLNDPPPGIDPILQHIVIFLFRRSLLYQIVPS
jgi:hypothetical protein